MAVDQALNALSQTAGSNTPAGADSVGADLDDHLRDIKKNIKFAASWPVNAKSASYLGLVTDIHTLVTFDGLATDTYTLPDPTACENGWCVAIKLLGAADLTIARNASENIDGAAADLTVRHDGNVVVLVTNSTDWFVIVGEQGDKTFEGAVEVVGALTNGGTAVAKTVTTTQGDIITRGASADGRLAKGADGAGLYSDGTDVVWGTNSSIQFVEKSDASVVNVTTADVTFDDNPFVITEGQELLSQVFTPLMSSSRLKIRVHAHGYYSTTLLAYMGLFDGNTNAIATTFQVADGTNAAGGHLIIDYVMPAADHTTAAITFTVRAAVSTGGWFINGKASSSRLLGGSSAMSMSIEEFGD